MMNVQSVPWWARLAWGAWIGLALGLALAMFLAVWWLGASVPDLRILMLSIGATGVASVAVGRIGMGWLRRGKVRIWLQITLTYLFGVAVALWNIWLTARLMFISSHDLPLLMLLMLVAACIATGLGAALAHVVSQRVLVLHQSASALARGDLSVRVPHLGDDELGGLGRAFNHMADELATAAAVREQQESARRELIAAISHDLRTPLASIRAMTDALSDGLIDDAATTERYYATMRAQIGQLNQLIEDLFSLARLDAGAIDVDLTPVAVGPLLHDALAAHSPRAHQQGVLLQTDLPVTPMMARGSPQYLLRVLDNLLSNALRHTPAGGQITIRALPTSGQMICVTVQDTGEGIVATDLPHIFERFYRSEKSRSREHGGSGLGLAIARGIVLAHGGSIQVQSVAGEGTQVSFTLPRAN